MSTDARIAHACPHHIRYEDTSVLGGREIVPLSPISGTGLLDLRKDGLSVPPEGLFSEADVVFPSTAPYRVKAGAQTLSIEVVGQAPVSITLPAKIISQAEMVRVLNGALPYPLVASAYKSSIRISDQLLSDGFKISGEVLSKLGFTSPSFRARKRESFPAWKIVKQRNFTGYKILLSKPYFSDSLIDVSYTTEKSYCRRCSGTGVENDIRFDDQGNLSMIEGYDLLYQRVAKVLLTERGSNPYQTFYGSTATRLIGQKVSAGVVQALKASVRKALDDLIDIQNQQASVQTMSFEERVKSVLNVEVSTVGDDETAYLVRVVVQSFSAQPVSINIVFAVPGSIPLDGDLT